MPGRVAAQLRASVRAVRIILHLAVGLVLALAVQLDFGRRLSRERLCRWWQSVLLDILNIDLRVRGAPLTGARLTVANHVSWLDIAVIGASEPTRFVAKSEVADWPIAGLLADACGTFYIRRGKGGAGPLLERLVPHLESGGSVVLFPEGTTTAGRTVLPFHPRLFSAAQQSGCPVQPVALRYGPGASGEPIAPFIGDDDLVSHLLRVLREPGLVAEVVYGAAIDPKGLTREQMAGRAHGAIALELQMAPVGPYCEWRAERQLAL